jgi:hypothetical protein
MQEQKRNKLAGSHPSYDKLNMSEERRKKKIAYDKKYHATTERKKYRAELNKANKSVGKKGDGLDQSHGKNGKLSFIKGKNGTKIWYRNGKRHREDGPAIEYVNGDKAWYLNGDKLTEAEFNARKNTCSGKVVEIDGKKYKLVEV